MKIYAGQSMVTVPGMATAARPCSGSWDRMMCSLNCACSLLFLAACSVALAEEGRASAVTVLGWNDPTERFLEMNGQDLLRLPRPQALEIEGLEDFRDECLQWTRWALKPRWIPEGMREHLTAAKDWFRLPTWNPEKQGEGKAGFAVRFETERHHIQIEDLNTEYVIGVKAKGARQSTDKKAREELVRKTALEFLAEPLVRTGKAQMPGFRIYISRADLMAGFWKCSGEIAYETPDGVKVYRRSLAKSCGGFWPFCVFLTDGRVVVFVLHKQLPAYSMPIFADRFDQRMLLKVRERQLARLKPRGPSYAEVARAKRAAKLKAKVREEFHHLVDELLLEPPRLPEPLTAEDFEGFSAEEIEEEKRCYAEELAAATNGRAMVFARQRSVLNEIRKHSVTELAWKVLALAFSDDRGVRREADSTLRALCQLPSYEELEKRFHLSGPDRARLKGLLDEMRRAIERDPHDEKGDSMLLADKIAAMGRNIIPVLIERMRDPNEVTELRVGLCEFLEMKKTEITVGEDERGYARTVTVTFAEPAVAGELMRIAHGIVGDGRPDDLSDEVSDLYDQLHMTARTILFTRAGAIRTE